MPVPAPRKGEDTKSFVSRCMGSKTMNKEFPETKQRAAVCYSALRKRRGKGAAPEKDKKASGLGVGGAPRRGRPKSNEERLKAHFGANWREHKVSELPARGSGLRRRKSKKGMSWSEKGWK